MLLTKLQYIIVWNYSKNQALKWSFFFDFCVSKFTPSSIPIKRGFVGGCRRIYILFTKSAPSKKHPLPIPTKMAFWGPYWEQCLPFVYKKAILKIVLSPNSHRNDESTPPYSILSSIGSRRKCTKYKFSDKKLVILICHFT